MSLNNQHIGATCDSDFKIHARRRSSVFDAGSEALREPLRIAFTRNRGTSGKSRCLRNYSISYFCQSEATRCVDGVQSCPTKLVQDSKLSQLNTANSNPRHRIDLKQVLPNPSPSKCVPVKMHINVIFSCPLFSSCRYTERRETANTRKGRLSDHFVTCLHMLARKHFR